MFNKFSSKYEGMDHKNKVNWGEVNWLFNVTINDISVIYVTANRCAGGLEDKVEPTVGLPTP